MWLREGVGNVLGVLGLMFSFNSIGVLGGFFSFLTLYRKMGNEREMGNVFYIFYRG